VGSSAADIGLSFDSHLVWTKAEGLRRAHLHPEGK